MSSSPVFSAKIFPRVPQGGVVRLVVQPNVNNVVVYAKVGLLFDDGTTDVLPLQLKTDNTTFTTDSELSEPFRQGAAVVSAVIIPHQSQVSHAIYCYLEVRDSTDVSAGGNVLHNLCSGWLGYQPINLGTYRNLDDAPWGRADTLVQYKQGNAAGGAVKVDITPGGSASGFYVTQMNATNSGTNTLTVRIYDNVSALDTLFIPGSLSSAAGVNLNLPAQGTTPQTSTNSPSSNQPYGLETSGTEVYAVEQSGAGAQNDLITVQLKIWFYGVLPTFSVARSTNAGNVTLNAGSTNWTVKG